MVFAAMYREKKHEEGRAKGLEEGIAEANAAWDEWNRRRMAAEANGEPFIEPPPSSAINPGSGADGCPEPAGRKTPT